MGDLDVLATDTERDQAIDRLRQACLDGRLTLAEYSQRLDKALTARTRGDLNALLADLAVPAPQTSPPPGAPVRKPTRFVLAVFGSARQAGRWLAGRRIVAISVLGSSRLDLRNARLDGTAAEIVAVALLGSVRIVVPPGAEVDCDGLAIFGHRGNVDKPEDELFGFGWPYRRHRHRWHGADDEGKAEHAAPPAPRDTGDDAPLVRVRAYALFGSVEIAHTET
jgi:hypothetical protein